MDKLRRTLPPLDPLVAFEAAARHQSFTRAAEELALSQAAVSQRIRQLEDHIGTPLFVRANRRVQLTTAGRTLQHAASPALRRIAAATEDVRHRPGRARLTIAADQSIAAMWLMPRLDAFRGTLDQDTSVRVVASDDPTDCLADDIELAILHGAGDWPGRQAALLFPEEVFPVCAPYYLTRHGPLSQAEQLLQHPLLELDDVQWDWMNWRGWLSTIGVDGIAQAEPLRINSYPLIIEAAKAGQGLALGWRHLVDQPMAEGQLVAPLPNSVTTEFGYYLIWPADRPLDPLTAAFRNWLLGQTAP
ncbi:MAG: LysR substrate-binding domain-containing protein [Pseudomonadota bacterium]